MALYRSVAHDMIVDMRVIIGICFLLSMVWSLNAFSAPIIIQTDTDAVQFEVEIARSAKALERGLMFRTRLPDKTGMLFSYDMPHVVNMWMRNTLIPLDILFIDARGVIVNIKENAQPHDETVVSSRYNVLSALEIPAGSVKKYGISVGNTVSLQ